MRFYHLRFDQNDNLLPKHHIEGEIKGRGGMTIAVLEEYNKAYIGVAVCSKRDAFSKKIGRAIAAGRAAKAKKEDVGIIVPKARSQECLTASFSDLIWESML